MRLVTEEKGKTFLKGRKMGRKPSVVDLFAGAGGLSEGFIRAGYEVVAYVEKDKNACDTLKTRHAYWILQNSGRAEDYKKYLKNQLSMEELHKNIDESLVINKEISDKTIPEIKKIIKHNMEKMEIDNIDLFIGGPPCQAYSLVGRARDEEGMKNDSRNELYKYYVELLKEFKPKMFVFENVPGLLSAKKGRMLEDIEKYFDQAGYVFKKDENVNILNAADFMVLQARKRVVVIGWRKDQIGFKYPKFEKQKHRFKVKSIFEDLPEIKDGDDVYFKKYKKQRNVYLEKTGIRNGLGFVVQHTTRPIRKDDKKIYKLAVQKWDKKKKRLSYTDIPKKIQTHNNKTAFLDRFKVVAKNLPYSHTLVAHIAKDGHYYIYHDKKNARSLSIREAARIQSFPDDYKFEGSRTSAFQQIGNAVPPLMSYNIARELTKRL